MTEQQYQWALDLRPRKLDGQLPLKPRSGLKQLLMGLRPGQSVFLPGAEFQTIASFCLQVVGKGKTKTVGLPWGVEVYRLPDAENVDE